MRVILSVVLLLTCATAPAWSQDATKPADDPTPALDKFALPPSAYDTSRFRYDPPADPSSGLSLPKVDLGASTLKFDAGRKEPANRVGIEALSPTQLGDIQRQQRRSLPNYLGLTLSKPLN